MAGARAGQRGAIKSINKTLAGLANKPSLAWDLSEVASLDHIGAQMFWNAWGKKRPDHLKLDPKQEELFARIEQASHIELPRTRTSPFNWIIVLGSGVLSFFEHLRSFILIGQVVQDVGRFIRHPMSARGARSRPISTTPASRRWASRRWSAS
jgi:phospholipid/cholesterol/gamma-HCH transport system permease protein